VNSFRRNLTLTVAASLLVWACAAHAEQKLKDKDCLACHSDATLNEDANGGKVSLYVDENKLKHSVHGDLFSCVDCHKDVKSLAHETTPQKVACAQCHADAQDGQGWWCAGRNLCGLSWRRA
jgi:nitrate reductase cytochrome c-type subunit